METELKFIQEAGRSKHREVLGEYLCSCGNTKIISVKDVKNGRIKSCGCFKSANKLPFREKFYSARSGMRKRCYDKKNDSYGRYGGRGIIVCERRHAFDNFKDDMYNSFIKHIQEYGPEDTSLDRIDVNGNYEPSNCRRATNQEQSTNRANSLQFEGKNVSEIAEELGIDSSILRKRINNHGREKAIEMGGHRLEKGKYEGMSYAERGKKLGVKEDTVRSRVFRLGRAKAIEMGTVSDEIITYKGKTVCQRAKELGINANTLFSRVYRNNNNLEFVIEDYKKEMPNSYQGLTAMQRAEKLGIGKTTIYTRIKKLGREGATQYKNKAIV